MGRSKLYSVVILLSFSLLLIVTVKACDILTSSKSLSVSDIEGNKYRITFLGDQVWMAENLRVSRYSNGDPISNPLSPSGWMNLRSGGWLHYQRDSSNDLKYGKLYNRYAVMDDRGICPDDFRVPSLEDWEELVEFLEDQGYPNDHSVKENAASVLMSCRQVNSPLGGNCASEAHPRWDESNSYYGIDAIGFSALPGGVLRVHHQYGLAFVERGNYAAWWSTSSYSSYYHYAFYNLRHSVNVDNFSPDNYGHSVRCVANIDDFTLHD